MLNLTPLQKIIFRFSLGGMLVICSIICSYFIVTTNNENATEYDKKLDNILKLEEIKTNFNQTKACFFTYVSTLDTADFINYTYAYAQLNKKNFLTKFKTENPDFRPDIETLQSLLEANNLFFENKATAVKSVGTDSAKLATLFANNGNFTQTEILLNSLLKLENLSLKSATKENGDAFEQLGYLIIIASIISLVLLIIFYYQSSNSFIKQAINSQEIIRVKEMAEAANSSKSEYLSMISYEIRTPMNGVLGMSNLLLQSSLSPEQKNYANTINKSAEGLLKIVNDVLDFSQLQADKLIIEKSNVSLASLIEDVCATLPRPAQNVKTSFVVSESIPKYIYSDPVRIKQILFNIIGNAIKYTKKGTVELECSLIETLENNDLRIGFIVKDTGVGIEKESIKTLFIPFNKIADKDSTKQGGTGLGLTIASNLINRLDGKIKVQSQIGIGSTFTFYITAQMATESVNTITNQAVNANSLDNELAKSYPFKILVVDDNEINLMLIIKILSKLGYECKKALNGQIAVDMVKTEHFDLIFMDMQMPVMDGTFASTEIRKHYRIYEYPVIIALTANALADGRDKCLEAGMQDFIAKPFKPTQIEEIIKKWAPKINEYRAKNQSGNFVR